MERKPQAVENARVHWDDYGSPVSEAFQEALVTSDIDRDLVLVEIEQRDPGVLGLVADLYQALPELRSKLGK